MSGKVWEGAVQVKSLIRKCSYHASRGHAAATSARSCLSLSSFESESQPSSERFSKGIYLSKHGSVALCRSSTPSWIYVGHICIHGKATEERTRSSSCGACACSSREHAPTLDVPRAPSSRQAPVYPTPALAVTKIRLEKSTCCRSRAAKQTQPEALLG